MSSLIPIVVSVARSFVGEKETGNNTGFADPKFQAEMVKSGWQRGQPWCAYMVETTFRIALLEAKREQLWKLLEPLFSGSAVETLHRFQQKGYTVKQTPSVGDIVIWRFGGGPNGHEGLVVELGYKGSKLFTTVEGNTTLEKRGTTDIIVRDADLCALRSRRYGMAVSNKPGAFNLMGFVSPVS